MLAAVGLGGFERRRYPSLSGGERQRVHLARVLTQLERPDAAHPGYLLLDEPTSSLDLGHQQRVLALALAFARAGGAVLVVLHDLSLAAGFADQVVLMHEGRVLVAGTPAQVLTPAHIDLAFDCEALVFELDGRIASIVARAP
jgi:iron complex transport system ATP-binding protein